MNRTYELMFIVRPDMVEEDWTNLFLPWRPQSTSTGVWLLREASQDELFWHGETDLYQQARALLKVPSEVSQDLTHFTTDPRVMLAYRDRVARMIERLQQVP